MLAKQEIEKQFRENLARVENLTKIYRDKITTRGKGRRPVGSTDVLRAAVVLLHATLEDLVRMVSRNLLPNQSEAVLDKVPLAGNGGRSGKFLLGKLVQHRGRTIDEVLSESVREFLERSNYNQPEDLVSAVESVGLHKETLEPLFDELRKMMDRRHWIVHRADRNPKSGRGNHQNRSIGTQCVTKWIETVTRFGDEIFQQLQ